MFYTPQSDCELIGLGWDLGFWRFKRSPDGSNLQTTLGRNHHGKSSPRWQLYKPAFLCINTIHPMKRSGLLLVPQVMLPLWLALDNNIQRKWILGLWAQAARGRAAIASSLSEASFHVGLYWVRKALRKLPLAWGRRSRCLKEQRDRFVSEAFLDLLLQPN